MNGNGKLASELDAPLDVFQPGLRRGAAKLPFAPHKRYFYVEHPVEGWRVYLRAATFIHMAGEPFDEQKFLVVKRTDGYAHKATWEPPKGQMEGKDTSAKKTVYQLLLENVRREVEEEAKVHNLQWVHHTGLIFQSREKDYPPNHFFQYHVFQAYVLPQDLYEAVKEFDWIAQHPDAFARYKKDKREKDALSWYNPRSTKLMGRWSPTIVAMYLQKFRKVYS
jgi:8-oxo-dGTP pyrophosphatase MutT (NUDIX family)